MIQCRGHVDGRVQEPLQLEPVRDCLKHARENLGRQDWSCVILAGKIPLDQCAEVLTAFQEVLVSWMVRMGGFDRQP